MTNNNTRKGNEMFEKLTSEDLIVEMDNYEMAHEFAAELELAAEVEDNYEHGDYRDELDLIDEAAIIDAQREIDTICWFDFDCEL
tara:strand:- start:563 stop:817 length:255 start_codon:yes stop_codon:yes gene_type:complete